MTILPIGRSNTGRQEDRSTYMCRVMVLYFIIIKRLDSLCRKWSYMCRFCKSVCVMLDFLADLHLYMLTCTVVCRVSAAQKSTDLHRFGKSRSLSFARVSHFENCAGVIGQKGQYECFAIIKAQTKLQKTESSRVHKSVHASKQAQQPTKPRTTATGRPVSRPRQQFLDALM